MVQELTDAGWEVQDQKMALGILELLIFLPLKSLGKSVLSVLHKAVITNLYCN